jgi:predicted nucleotidyltransferase component of viral defense system
VEQHSVISREEIDAKSAELGVDPSHVQQDYVAGWVLAGLYGESPLGRQLVLKGGNALRKGYFGDTRFSEDLDFAITNRVNPAAFLDALNDVGRLAQARTGVQFHLEHTAQIGRERIKGAQTVYTFGMSFTDFYGCTETLPVSLHMDVTELTRLHLSPQSRSLIHPYSDHADCTADLTVMHLDEVLADKLKCLLQRQSIRDLFDLSHSILFNDEIPIDRKNVVSTFLRKTIFSPSPAAALNLLAAIPFEGMQVQWDDSIVCSRETRQDLTDTVTRWKDELRQLFADFRLGEQGQLAFFPAHLRTPIMDAGAQRKLLRLTYKGRTRLVEPYALRFKRRQDGIGQEYLYIWDRTGGHSRPGIKSLLNYRIDDLTITDEPFEPRYEIELAKAGELTERPTFSQGPRHRTHTRIATRRPRPRPRRR